MVEVDAKSNALKRERAIVKAISARNAELAAANGQLQQIVESMNAEIGRLRAQMNHRGTERRLRRPDALTPLPSVSLCLCGESES